MLAGLTEAQCDELVHDWEFLVDGPNSPKLPPPGDWSVWLFLAGRGAGKTRSGAEWVRAQVKAGVGLLGLIAPTAADARDVMVGGPGGILANSWARDVDLKGNNVGRPIYEPSKRLLTWGNGATALLFSAEEPERLRGPQFEALWCDELAAWHEPEEAWDMAMFGLRLGEKPRALVTTTPKPIDLIRKLLVADNCVVTRSTTYANLANLAPSFRAQIIARYEGTRLGRQELDGELIEDVDGALWQRSMIDYRATLPDMLRVVVAIDPAVSSGKDSALTGIVACGLGVDGRGYVLADVSGRYSPDRWAREALQLFDALKADRLVAEGNQGGEMVRTTIETVRPNAPIRIVHASRSKQARAEPIAALYEQGKVSHARPFPELEDQLCSWEPLSGQASPDRLDALVWAFTDLMIGAAPTIDIGMPVQVGAGESSAAY